MKKIFSPIGMEGDTPIFQCPIPPRWKYVLEDLSGAKFYSVYHVGVGLHEETIIPLSWAERLEWVSDTFGPCSPLDNSYWLPQEVVPGEEWHEAEVIGDDLRVSFKDGSACVVEGYKTGITGVLIS